MMSTPKLPHSTSADRSTKEISHSQQSAALVARSTYLHVAGTSPSWHADRHSACAACLTCQPVVSSCRGDILPHTTTLERLNRFTNSGDISFTRLVEKVAIFIFHQSEPTHCQHYSYPRTMTSAVFCHPPPHMAIRR